MKTSPCAGMPSNVWLLVLPCCLLRGSPAPLGAPSPYGTPGKGLGWGRTCSPIAAGLRWSDSPDPDAEGTWGMEWAGGAASLLSACSPQETWAFLEELLDFFETYISWAKSRVS